MIMNKTNLAGIDLNLIVVLAALLEEKSVTRAAQTLGSSQSAVSHALRRLRVLLDDPLFVRSPEGMLATPAALALVEPLRDILGRMEDVFLRAKRFDPARDSRCFMIGFTDYTSFVFLPRLVAALERTAPAVDLVVKNTSYTLGYDMIENDEAEIIVGNFPGSPNFIRERVLYQEEYVCLMRRDHPAAGRKMTLERYLESKHILVSLQGKMIGYLDRAIHRLGIVRKTRFTIGHFMLVPFIIMEHNAIATEPSRLMVPLARTLGLKTARPPFQIESQPIKMAWHRRYDNDAGHKWMRELIVSMAD